MGGKIEFLKMHGAGNDFVVIGDPDERLVPDPGFVSSLCAFHRGIGADGMILICRSKRADFRMRYFNSDGGEAELCGNGARCAALFAFKTGIADRSMEFETGSGLVRADVLEGGIRIDIGEVRDLKLRVDMEGSDVEAHYAVSGVPHVIVLVDEARGYPSEDFLAMARTIRRDPVFAPRGTNVDLVSIRSKNELFYRTYERGVEAETLACGTGAVAAAVITSHLNLTEPPVVCETSGGDFLEVEFGKADYGADKCRLRGPAVVSFEGTFLLEDYISDTSSKTRRRKR